MNYLLSPLSSNSLLSGNSSNSAMDVSRPSQQNSVADQNIHSKSQNHPFSFSTGMKQDSSSLNPMLKKSRIDANANTPQEQNAQQSLPRQDIEQSPDYHPQLRAMLPHQRQHVLDSVPQSCGVQAQQSEQQFRHHLHQRPTYPFSFGNDGMCSQRIQLLYNLKNQPQDTSINFWRRIVSDFYAPCAKERWCLSSYKNIGKKALDVLSLGDVGQQCCGLCGSGAGKGFEASFEVLPRLWKIKFECGVLEEILSLAFPKEHKIPSGVMLEYDKAVQQSVYKQFRVVHEGKLRVLFRHDLKILSWEFCARHHDEYFLRSLIAPQVNHLVSVAQAYQSMHTEGTSVNKVPMEKLLGSCKMFANARNQLIKSLELPTVDELGFSIRYLRAVQTAEVLDIMKDLMSYSLDQNLGPIDSMHAYCHQGSRKEYHRRSSETEEQEKAQGMSTPNVLTNGNSFTCRNTGLPSEFNDGSTFGTSADLELLVANYYQTMSRENMLSPRTFVLKSDQSHLMDTANHRAISSQFQGNHSPSSGLLNNSALAGLPSPVSSEVVSKNIEQQMNDKLIQNAFEEHNDCETRENMFSGMHTAARATNITMTNETGIGNSNSTALAPANSFGSVRGNAESSRVAPNSDSLKVAGSNLGMMPETAMVEFPLPEAIQGIHGQQQFTRNDI